MKYCKRCDSTKPLSSFTKASSRYDGMQAYCRDCMRLYRTEHYQSNKQQYKDRNRATKDKIRDFVRELKKLPCSDCPASYPDEPWLMEFDHLDGADKTKAIAHMISDGSLRKVKEEILKCDLVCVVCHRRRTAKRAGWTSEDSVL